MGSEILVTNKKKKLKHFFSFTIQGQVFINRSGRNKLKNYTKKHHTADKHYHYF